MPTATGDIREIVGQPVFVPLYRLFLTYGKVRFFLLFFSIRDVTVLCECEVHERGKNSGSMRASERGREKVSASDREKKPKAHFFFSIQKPSTISLPHTQKNQKTKKNQIFRLAFGPKVFIVVSDPELAKQVLVTDAANYSKGLLSEILDFVMGKGLIPADGEVWRERRRAVVPALHRRYIESMLGMFGSSALHGAELLEGQMSAGGGGEAIASSHLSLSPSSSSSSSSSVVVEIENIFSRLTLDIIGKAVFNYDFDSLKNDDPFIQAVYTTLREAEYRSTAFVPYWNFAPLRWLVSRFFFYYLLERGREGEREREGEKWGWSSFSLCLPLFQRKRE